MVYQFFASYRTQLCYLILLAFSTGSTNTLVAQSTTQMVEAVDSQTVIVVAGPQYKREGLKQWLLGKHYREEWLTPVKMPVAYLDTLSGGLHPYQRGGGRQSKTLRLWDDDKREYVLRSIDKTFGRALPEILQNTFIEKIIDDQVTIAHPYAAVTIPSLAQAAGIYHTTPRIYYFPKQKRLEQYEDYENQLFLFEQRPDENWEPAWNFGNSKNIVGTEKLFENLTESNTYRVDQQWFIRSRLFDMFIGDWGRHEDQWRWASFENDSLTVYKAIPRDRDQVYTRFDGFLPGLFSKMTHLQSFDSMVKNISQYNFPARYLDRRVANEMTVDQWVQQAKEIQESITDQQIDEAVKKLPPELYHISGPRIAANVKSRKNKLQDFAREYALVLAREVDIPASIENEYFKIQILDNEKVSVSIYPLDGDIKGRDALYHRVFFASETNEIRLYGLAGNDRYEISGQGKSPILVRIIGGPGKDVYTSNLEKTQQVRIYDNEANDFAAPGIKKIISSNAFIHYYKYDDYKYNKSGITPVLSYSREDRLHVGLAYKTTRQHWRRYPYGVQHQLAYHYSLSENSYSVTYNGDLVELLGNWNANLFFNYDNIRWTNYFGIGNESVLLTKARDYHRFRTRELYSHVGINQLFAFYHRLDFNLFYNSIKILPDDQRFLTDDLPLGKRPPYKREHFAGPLFQYTFSRLNDPLVPTKGSELTTSASISYNLNNTDSAFSRFTLAFNQYLPVSKSFVFRFRAGAATVTGDPEFYQLNQLGGGDILRGYRRSRFYGKSMVFNQNELQFIKDVRSYMYNGKAGLVALFDVGRVWHPGESSNQWHMGYGGGIILAPFEKIAFYVTYAFSNEDSDFGLRIHKKL